MKRLPYASSGFTAVELLITLFVAAAFLIAGYQLFNVVIQDGGETRAESRAGNVAYEYLRRYTDSATNPCAPSSPLTDSSISVDGLTDVTLSVMITCPQADAPSLSKVEAMISYNTPQKTLNYATYVDKSSGAEPVVEVTNGLVGWWKMNGNANSEVGTVNGTPFNVTPTAGQNGQANGAYSFNGTNSYIQVPAGFADFTNGVSVSVWIKPAATANANGNHRIIHFGSTLSSNNDSFMLYDLAITSTLGFGTYSGATGYTVTATSMLVNNAWNHYVATQVGSSAVLYKNGVQVATGTGGTLPNLTRNYNFIGAFSTAYLNNSYTFNGALDDLRIYNRAVTGSEVLQLYNWGAK